MARRSQHKRSVQGETPAFSHLKFQNSSSAGVFLCPCPGCEDPGHLLLAPGRGGRCLPVGRKGRVSQVSAPLCPNHLHSQRLYRRSRPTSSRGEETLPGMSDGVSKAPLPQGPWTPVLLGPYAGVPLRCCLRVTGYLFTELSSCSSCCRNQEGRRRWSLPSSRISPPAPPPVASSRQALGCRSALPPCSPED